MALFHFVNCSLATFIPYYIIYDGFKLSKNVGATKLFFLVCFYYIISQILKLFALAFCSIGLFQSMNLFNIIFQELANIIDLAGIYYILSHKHTNSINLNERILSVGLSWGFYESLATNFFPFLIGGKSLEFSLKHIYRSISANTFLFSNLSKTCLLFMWMKNTSGKTKINVVNSLLVYFTFILPLVNRIILINEESFRSDIFIQLLLEFVLTFFLSIITKFIFSSQLNISHENKNASYSDDDIYQVNKDLKKKDKKKKKN
ncbi:conserved membrane protein, unknown function [Plasmodium sp. gorilla clade G2]|uniref:conserved membrane protein, unknown function n=1 Tax=Plasmodium sp. gorilla clade G2 TaxID=880535 RepID=UPI000D200090|nr:conserved membrane protein, unknown function [Plasmodium sp. gorilla clade G2]SOV14647.1 conserved membrane protein, unknown function [Plasmodium sp. gorilla clade G2]